MEFRAETRRLQALHDKATSANVYTAKEEEALQTRLQLLESLASAKEAMKEGAERAYSSQMSVDRLRSHASELDAALHEALAANAKVKSTWKLTRSESMGKTLSRKGAPDKRDNYIQRAPEHDALLEVAAAVRAMADAKQEAASATGQGRAVTAKTSLTDARMALVRMRAAREGARAAKAHGMPEMAPLETMLSRVGPMVLAKQEVHDSYTAPVGGKTPVATLRGTVTARMVAARAQARQLDAYGGEEEAALEARLLAVEEMAAAKVMAPSATCSAPSHGTARLRFLLLPRCGAPLCVCVPTLAAALIHVFSLLLLNLSRCASARVLCGSSCAPRAWHRRWALA